MFSLAKPGIGPQRGEAGSFLLILLRKLIRDVGAKRFVAAMPVAVYRCHATPCQCSIVSLDWAFDNLGYLSEKFTQMLFYVVSSQTHRLISTSLVLKHAEGRALAVASIKPIVTHKPLRILNDWHEFLAYPAVNLCTLLWIKVIMTNNSKHDASPSLNFPISTFFCEDDLCVAFRVKLES